jgi:hypothetical protein
MGTYHTDKTRKKTTSPTLLFSSRDDLCDAGAPPTLCAHRSTPRRLVAPLLPLAVSGEGTSSGKRQSGAAGNFWARGTRPRPWGPGHKAFSLPTWLSQTIGRAVAVDWSLTPCVRAWTQPLVLEGTCTRILAVCHEEGIDRGPL